ncbi:hypothetical protein [Comamonas testosteroni]|jgi:hypothetical protein|uniref:hypothetical protein n=1 Tax=Comamonas testosteroni TaxID=285 RepID=UPI0026ECA66F|nr:hypothetical protein [Comamonas testosteroni]WQD42611.1 hypothetical protein U0024_23325 [Comamonas testosteroni]
MRRTRICKEVYPIIKDMKTGAACAFSSLISDIKQCETHEQNALTAPDSEAHAAREAFSLRTSCSP